MSTLTLKSNRPKKSDNRSFRRAGIEVPGVFTRMEVPEKAVPVLKKERMIIVADDMNAAELVDAINKLNDVSQIKALMACSKAKGVQAAGNERIGLFGGDASETEESSDKDELLKDIEGTSTVDELKDLDEKITASKISNDDLKEVMEAQSARKTALEG